MIPRLLCTKHQKDNNLRIVLIGITYELPLNRINSGA